jgi:hypothetical protein
MNWQQMLIYQGCHLIAMGGTIGLDSISANANGNDIISKRECEEYESIQDLFGLNM